MKLEELFYIDIIADAVIGPKQKTTDCQNNKTYAKFELSLLCRVIMSEVGLAPEHDALLNIWRAAVAGRKSIKKESRRWSTNEMVELGGISVLIS